MRVLASTMILYEGRGPKEGQAKFNKGIPFNRLYTLIGAQTRASDPNSFQPPPFGRGSGPIFWDDVRCTGSELRLEECPHLTTPEGSEDCIHDEDVGVMCQPLPLNFTSAPATTTISKSHRQGCPLCLHAIQEKEFPFDM